MLRKLVEAGTDVFRLNFSHGTVSEHQSIIRRIRGVEEETGKAVAILQDLPGPKIRLGVFKMARSSFMPEIVSTSQPRKLMEFTTMASLVLIQNSQHPARLLPKTLFYMAKIVAFQTGGFWHIVCSVKHSCDQQHASIEY